MVRRMWWKKGLWTVLVVGGGLVRDGLVNRCFGNGLASRRPVGDFVVGECVGRNTVAESLLEPVPPAPVASVAAGRRQNHEGLWVRHGVFARRLLPSVHG